VAEDGDREERHVRALAKSLRKAIEQVPSEEGLNQITRAAMGVQPTGADQSSEERGADAAEHGDIAVDEADAGH
jgi:hypothetical protein